MPVRKNPNTPRTPLATGLTRGESPMQVRQRTYPPRSSNQPRTTMRSNRPASNYHQRNTQRNHNHNRQLSRELDERLVELQALFDVSKTLNSSLQLKQILDTLLLTPMGKMMIGKGLIMLARREKLFVIETVKGLQQSNIGRELEVDLHHPMTVMLQGEESNEIAQEPWAVYLKKMGMQIIIPIICNNSCKGLMAFSSKISGQQYATNEIEYLNSLANLAATAVENGMIFQELKEVNRKLDKKIQELNTLFDIGKELNSTLESDKIASVLAYALMGELMAQRCWVFTEQEGKMQLSVAKGGEDAPILNDAEFLVWLTGLRAPQRLHSENSLLKAEWLESLKAAGILLIVPLISQEVVRGAIFLGEKITKGEYAEEEIEFAATLGNTALISLENARLFQVTLEKQKLEEELAIAREIQQKLLPKDAPKLNGYEMAAINIPTKQVGGDYFDYFPIDADRYVLTVADVSGKGVPAALLMSNLQATLHAMMTADVPLDKIVARINDFVHANTTYDKFITFFVGVLDVSAHKFTYVNGGHNPPYLFHKIPLAEGEPEFRLLDKGGLLLGMFPGVPYESETVTLQSGDLLLMYTDGVSEAMNAKEEEFTEQRIEQTIRNRRALPGVSAAALIDAITSEVKQFTAGQPQSDDITLLALLYNSESA